MISPFFGVHRMRAEVDSLREQLLALFLERHEVALTLHEASAGAPLLRLSQVCILLEHFEIMSIL